MLDSKLNCENKIAKPIEKVTKLMLKVYLQWKQRRQIPNNKAVGNAKFLII
jgi:hypothetical protein